MIEGPVDTKPTQRTLRARFWGLLRSLIGLFGRRPRWLWNWVWEREWTALSDRKLHVWSDGDDCDRYVAYDAADAHALQLETLGENCAELDDWHQLPDDRVITIDFEDESVHGFTGKVKKTCREWAATMGRGFLCSSEF